MLALPVTTAVSCYASFVLMSFQYIISMLLVCIITFFFFYRKKKDKERKNLEEQVMTTQNEKGTKKVYVDKRTPAQISFDKIQEKRVFITFYNCHRLFSCHIQNIMYIF